MKTLSICIILLSLPSLTLAWTDDFESYPSSWNPLPSPWETTVNQCAYAGLGYNGSKGTCGPSYNWEWGHAYRPIDANANVLHAMMYLNSGNTYQGAQVGFIGSKSYSGSGYFAGSDLVKFYLWGDDANHVTLSLITEDYNNSGVYQTDNRINITGLSENTWYDVRIKLHGLKAIGEYKNASSGTWTTVGTVSLYSGFVPNYVAISCLRGGYMDYIESTVNLDAGVTAYQVDANGFIYEQGTTSNTFDIVLEGQPNANVTVSVDPDIQTQVNSNGAGNPVNLTFTTANWYTPQSITVTAVDDDIYEGSHISNLNLTAASSDNDYNNIAINNINVFIFDWRCDDFESYPSSWNPLPSPWETAVNQCAYTGLGYNGSKGTCGPSYNWEWGHAYRPIDANANVLHAMMYLDSGNTYQGAQVGFIGSKSYSGNGCFAGSDLVKFYLWGDNANNVTLTLISEDYNDSGVYQTDNRINVTGLSENTWYDVRGTLNGTTFAGEYKLSSASEWTAIGSVTTYSGFAANYVGISCLRSGYMDNIGWEKEPEILLLEFGQTTPDPNLMRANVDYWEGYLPFNGIVFYVNSNEFQGRYGCTSYGTNDDWWSLDSRVFRLDIIDYNDYNDAAINLANTNFRKFKHNFLLMTLNPSYHWVFNWIGDNNDSAWSIIEQNVKVLARIAREGGCEGIFIDTEYYGPGGYLFWYDYQSDPNKGAPGTWSQYKAKVKARGEDFINAIETEFPNCHIILTFGPSIIPMWYAEKDYLLQDKLYAESLELYEPNEEKNYSHQIYALLAPFVEGMLKGANSGTKITDGFENSYFFKNRWEFGVVRDFILNKVDWLFDDPNYYDGMRLGLGQYYTRVSPTSIDKFTIDETVKGSGFASEQTEDVVWIWSQDESWWFGNGDTPVPTYAMPITSNDIDDFLVDANSSNIMLSNYYAVDPNYIDAIKEGSKWGIPGPAYTPFPVAGAIGASIATDLSWNSGNRAVKHQVYFGTDSTLDSSEYKGEQTGTSYYLGTLTANTTYYWRIDEVSKLGNVTIGTVWSFTTASLVTKLTDGFETNFNNWTDGGTTDWDRTTSYEHSGSYSAHAGSSDNDLISDNINTSGYYSMTITCWYMDDDIDDDDNIYLQLYDGTNYDNKFELGNISPEDTWHKYEVTLYNSGSNTQYFHSNFRLKFEGTSIDYGENLWIDDVSVVVQY